MLNDWSEENKLLSSVFAPSPTSAGNGVDYGYGDDGLRKWSHGFTFTNTRQIAIVGPMVYYIYSGDTVIGEISSTVTTGSHGQLTYTATANRRLHVGRIRLGQRAPLPGPLRPPPRCPPHQRPRCGTRTARRVKPASW